MPMLSIEKEVSENALDFRTDAFTGTPSRMPVDLVFTDPIMQGLGNTTDLGRNGFNGSPQR